MTSASVPDTRFVAGVDPSLTSCGVTTLGRWSISGCTGSKGVTALPLQERIAKVHQLADDAIRLLTDPFHVFGWPVLVLVEAPDASRSYGGLVERISLTCLITQKLVDRQIPVGWVPSAVLKGYATGKGGGEIDGVEVKRVVLREAQRIWPELGIANTDQADSAFLAAMAADVLGLGRVVPDDQSAQWLYRDSIQYPGSVRPPQAP